MLVIQEFVQSKDSQEDHNVRLALVLAQQMEESARVVPIVWSLTDPIFRDAVSSGVLVNAPEKPTLAQARDAARRLKADYLLVFTAVRDIELLKGDLKLYRGSSDRTVWTDKRDMTVLTGNTFDAESGAQSLARTWNQLLNGDPFKGHPAQSRATTPEPEPGQPTTGGPQTPTRTNSDPAVIAEAEALLKAKQVAKAIALLRDAVDSVPLDVERRKALILALMALDPALAAAESSRAAELLPEAASLRAVAARAWLLAGNAEKAQEQLKEALARDPNNSEVLVLVARSRLAALDADGAMEALTTPLLEPNTEAFFLVAVAEALRGRQAQADAALKKSAAQEADYPLSIDLIDRAVGSLAIELRTLIPRLRMPGGEKEEADGFSRIVARCGALTWLGEQLKVPSSHQGSHDRRLLALKLLRLSLDDVGTFLKSRDESYLSESTINLGEALKQLAAAREQYRQETSS